MYKEILEADISEKTAKVTERLAALWINEGYAVHVETREEKTLLIGIREMK